MKLRPTKDQRRRLEELSRTYRAVYNKLVEVFRERYASKPEHERPLYSDVLKDLCRYTTLESLLDDAIRLPQGTLQPPWTARITTS